MIVPSGDNRPLVTYFQPYNSCNVISENSVLDQLITPLELNANLILNADVVIPI